MMCSLHFYNELFTNKVDFIYIAPFLPRGFWDPAILTFFDVLCYEKVLQIKKSFRSLGWMAFAYLHAKFGLIKPTYMGVMNFQS